uniref:Uncharacterized protein n=1 Tax=mine drainage metagenome TaxID=410659 RepID=E6QBV7_9ZZZZ
MLQLSKYIFNKVSVRYACLYIRLALFHRHDLRQRSQRRQ